MCSTSLLTIISSPASLDYREAAMMGMRRKIQGLTPLEMREVAKDVKDIPTTKEDLLAALQRVSKSVSKEDLKKYEDWMNEFGSV